MQKAWISCLILAGLLLIAGCSPKKDSAKLPEASSAVSASSGAASSQTTSAPEEPAVQPEESGAPSPKEGGSQEQEPGPDPEPDPPAAAWTLLPDRGDPTWMPSPLYEPEELPSCVTVRPVQDEYTTDDTSIGVCVQNTGDKYFLFDLEYRLEKSTQEGWTDLDLKPYPIDVDRFLCVEPGQSKTQAYSLSNLVQAAGLPGGHSNDPGRLCKHQRRIGIPCPRAPVLHTGKGAGQRLGADPLRGACVLPGNPRRRGAAQRNGQRLRSQPSGRQVADGRGLPDPGKGPRRVGSGMDDLQLFPFGADSRLGLLKRPIPFVSAF